MTIAVVEQARAEINEILASGRTSLWPSHLQAARIIEQYLWALGHRTTTVEALVDSSRWS